MQKTTPGEFASLESKRTYGNTFWASIDPQVAKEIATEFRLYKNKTLLSLLDYSGNGTDSDKINHFSKDIVLQPLMELLVQWQLRTCLTEFKESIHQFRIAVAHTVFYQPMPDIDTNWKYIFYQLIIHTGKQPSRTYEESVSFQKNFQIQDKENAEIKRFLSDLSIYCNLGIHIVVHENKFPSNTMEIYGNQGYKYLHIIVWKNFGHFISLSWEQNKALNNQMRKGGGVFKEIDYQEEFQYLRNKDQDENYQIMQNGIYIFKPCAEIQKLQQVQVRVLKNSWDSDVQEEEENPMIEDFADLMKNYSVKSSTSKKQITQTPPQTNSVKKKIKKVIQKKNGINFLQDICFFRQQLNGSPIQFENLSYEDYVIAPKDYEQLLVYKDIICVRSRGKFYMLNQRQAIQFSNQFQGQILNRWTQDILVKGCMLPSPPELRVFFQDQSEERIPIFQQEE